MVEIFFAICIGILLATAITLIWYGIAKLIFYIICVTIDKWIEKRDLRKRNQHRTKCGLPKLKIKN